MSNANKTLSKEQPKKVIESVNKTNSKAVANDTLVDDSTESEDEDDLDDGIEIKE